MITQLNKTPNHHRSFKLVQLLKHRGVALGVLGVLLSATANAQTRSITLEEAVRLGVQTSKTLKLSQAKIDQAVSQYNQAKDKALPTGSATLYL